MEFQHLSRFATWLAAATFACAANASTTTPTTNSYLATHKAVVTAPAAAIYAALGQPEKWWDPAHTYSGKAGNLKLELRAGGCFCETWEGGSVEHLRVILALKDRTLRLVGGLGPLQEKAVTGVLTFTLNPEGATTRLLVTYRVRAAEGGLDHTAELVDQIVGEQVARLVSFVQKK